MGGVLEWSLEECLIEGNAAGIQARSESGRFRRWAGIRKKPVGLIDRWRP